MRGLFVTLEGADGTGKSTQAELLVERLKRESVCVVKTREPGGCDISDRIRAVVLDPALTEMEPVTEALLYAAARAQHVRQVIRPSLNRGAVVVCDRFIDSSLAYQAYGRELGVELVLAINREAMNGCLPDITFLLTLDPEQGLQRHAQREHDRMEQASADFRARLACGYEDLPRLFPERIVTIDASLPVEQLHELIYLKVKNKIES